MVGIRIPVHQLPRSGGELQRTVPKQAHDKAVPKTTSDKPNSAVTFFPEVVWTSTSLSLKSSTSPSTHASSLSSTHTLSPLRSAISASCAGDTRRQATEKRPAGGRTDDDRSSPRPPTLPHPAGEQGDTDRVPARSQGRSKWRKLRISISSPIKLFIFYVHRAGRLLAVAFGSLLTCRCRTPPLKYYENATATIKRLNQIRFQNPFKGLAIRRRSRAQEEEAVVWYRRSEMGGSAEGPLSCTIRSWSCSSTHLRPNLREGGSTSCSSARRSGPMPAGSSSPPSPSAALVAISRQLAVVSATCATPSTCLPQRHGAAFSNNVSSASAGRDVAEHRGDLFRIRSFGICARVNGKRSFSSKQLVAPCPCSSKGNEEVSGTLPSHSLINTSMKLSVEFTSALWNSWHFQCTCYRLIFSTTSEIRPLRPVRLTVQSGTCQFSF